MIRMTSPLLRAIYSVDYLTALTVAGDLRVPPPLWS